MIVRSILNAAAVCLAAAVSGCSTAQLKPTQLAVTNTISDIYTQQTLANLGRTINDRWYIPSQTNLSTGQVTTSNLVTPSLTVPLSRVVTDASTTASGGSITDTLQRPSSGLTVSGNQGWQQVWNSAPVVNAQKLAHLRALYRYVLFSEFDPVHADYLRRVYPNGPKGWIYWRGAGSASRLPVSDKYLRSLGWHGGAELLVDDNVFLNGYVSNFVLATMADYVEPNPPTLALPTARVVAPAKPTRAAPAATKRTTTKPRSTGEPPSPKSVAPPPPAVVRPQGGGSIDPGNSDRFLRELQGVPPVNSIPVR